MSQPVPDETPEEKAASTYIEEAEIIVNSFRYELCELCHLDLNQHTIGPDPLGHAHLFCTTLGE